MQSKSYFVSILIAIIFLSSYTVSAQIVGPNCFLKGLYVEVGINTCGAFGSSVAPPVGYHPTEGGLGFVADWESDGWATGTPIYCGDYFVPGTPVEGWQIQIGANVWTNTDQGCSPSDIPGDVTDYSFAGGIYTGTWTGNITTPTIDLDVTQITTLPEDKLYFVTRILLCNNGDEPLEDVYYKRNVDPDNDQPWSGDYTTYNEIVYQPPGDPEALVTSEGLTYGCFLGIGARDENARVSFGLFGTADADPKDVWDATGGYTGTGSNTDDEANSIAFYIPVINPGECKCVAFAYILNVDDLDEALEATVTYNLTADDVTVSSGDTATVCNPGETVDLSILGADDYTWTWTPSTGLSADTGINVTATVTETTTYTITGVGGFCGDATLTITVQVDENEFADAGDDVELCLGETTVLSGDGGEFDNLYSWSPATYLSCTDCPNPTADITVAGTYTYTLTTYDIYNCPATDEITVIVHPLPVVDAGEDVDLCPEGSIQLEATGAVDYEWSPSTGLSCTDCPDPICTVNDNTTYTVTGTDEFGCVNTDQVDVSVFSTLDILVTADPSTIDSYLGETSQLEATGAESYTWTPAFGLSGTDIPNPIAAPKDTTTYIVTGVDANGCTDIDTITINVIGELTVGIPTAFSPNGDGHNDTWAPQYSGSGFIQSYMIYNRYGELVYSGDGTSPGWNGEFNGKAQGIGTFVVVIKAYTSLNEERFSNGNFTLVR